MWELKAYYFKKTLVLEGLVLVFLLLVLVFVFSISIFTVYL